MANDIPEQQTGNLRAGMHSFAIPVTGMNKRRLEVLKQRRGEREAHELNTMTELSKSLSKLTCVITVKTGDDGKTYRFFLREGVRFRGRRVDLARHLWLPRLPQRQTSRPSL